MLSYLLHFRMHARNTATSSSPPDGTAPPNPWRPQPPLTAGAKEPAAAGRDSPSLLESGAGNAAGPALTPLPATSEAGGFTRLKGVRGGTHRPVSGPRACLMRGGADCDRGGPLRQPARRAAWLRLFGLDSGWFAGGLAAVPAVPA